MKGQKNLHPKKPTTFHLIQFKLTLQKTHRIRFTLNSITQQANKQWKCETKQFTNHIPINTHQSILSKRGKTQSTHTSEGEEGLNHIHQCVMMNKE